MDAKPQGSQLKLLNWVEAFKEQIFFDGAGCRMNFTLLISDLAEAAERIEKLERENAESKEKVTSLVKQKFKLVEQVVTLEARLELAEQERDTALRALAEARRERDESIRAHKNMTHEASRIGMLHLDNHLGDVYHAMQNLRVGYGAKRSGHFLQDAASQPEKDANNG